MTLQELWNELWSKSTLAGAILGIVISITIWVVSKIIKFISDWREYDRYAGTYSCFLKNKPLSQHYTINLKRSWNKFTVTGNSHLGNKDPIKGEIEMSTSLKKQGKGYYYHDIEGQKRKFGFYEMQLTPDDILVHQDIKNLKKNDIAEEIEIGEDCSASYVWIKQ